MNWGGDIFIKLHKKVGVMYWLSRHVVISRNMFVFKVGKSKPAKCFENDGGDLGEKQFYHWSSFCLN